MEISDFKEPDGRALIAAIVAATGLPRFSVERELRKILKESGHQAADVTLDQLRGAMVAYLESMNQDILTPDLNTMDEAGRPVC